ncbi:MAG: monovalent cation/H+ antiporter complex subunit F [Proteocatella sp.]
MNIVLIALTVLSFVSALRILSGPSLWDRLLGLNLVTSKMIMMMIIVAMVKNQDYLLDIGLVYALSSFIGIIFIAHYVQKKGRY